MTESKVGQIQSRQLYRDIALEESFSGVVEMSVTSAPDVIKTADMANYAGRD